VVGQLGEGLSKHPPAAYPARWPLRRHARVAELAEAERRRVDALADFRRPKLIVLSCRFAYAHRP